MFAEEWPENVTLRVRMGLHTGVAEESEGDYFGPPVNRIARLMSTGHGGQVVLSDATYNLVRDALVHMEPEAELRYLGEHRLKDLRYTERIFQLVVPDLSKEFPPLKTRGLIAPPEMINLDHHYRRIEYLGSGGFGNVYLVHHEALDKHTVLKVNQNTGNVANQQGVLQDGPFIADDVVLEGGDFEFAPENETSCDQKVQQAAATSS